MKTLPVIALGTLLAASVATAQADNLSQDYIHTINLHTIKNTVLENVGYTISGGQGTAEDCQNLQQIAEGTLPEVYNGMKFGVGKLIPEQYSCISVTLKTADTDTVDAFSIEKNEDDGSLKAFPHVSNLFLE